MVYWLASAPRPIHSSHLIIVQPPTPPRTLHCHPHARHVTGPPPRPPTPRTAGQRPAARHVTGPPPPPPPPRTARQRPAAPAHAHAPARPRSPARPPAHQLLRRCGSSGARDRGPRLALRPAHGPLGCGSSGSGVLLALLARLPLGLHVALDLSPIDLRRWALFGHPLHAEMEEAPLPGRPVGLGRFRPFPNGFTGSE